MLFGNEIIWLRTVHKIRHTSNNNGLSLRLNVEFASFFFILSPNRDAQTKEVDKEGHKRNECLRAKQNIRSQLLLTLTNSLSISLSISNENEKMSADRSGWKCVHYYPSPYVCISRLVTFYGKNLFCVSLLRFLTSSCLSFLHSYWLLLCILSLLCEVHRQSIS